MLRLSRKADVDARTRLITSVYLPESEFAVLAAALPGRRLRKIRHRLPWLIIRGERSRSLWKHIVRRLRIYGESLSTDMPFTPWEPLFARSR